MDPMFEEHYIALFRYWLNLANDIEFSFLTYPKSQWCGSGFPVDHMLEVEISE